MSLINSTGFPNSFFTIKGPSIIIKSRNWFNVKYLISPLGNLNCCTSGAGAGTGFFGMI